MMMDEWSMVGWMTSIGLVWLVLLVLIVLGIGAVVKFLSR